MIALSLAQFTSNIVRHRISPLLLTVNLAIVMLTVWTALLHAGLGLETVAEFLFTR